MILRLQHPPEPEFASVHAQLAADLYLRGEGSVLDYSPESLTKVDGLLGSFREEGANSEEMAETLFIFGCYVGEVLARNLSGRWRRADEALPPDISLGDAWMMIELPNGSVWNPIGKAFRRVDEGREHQLGYFYQVVAESGAA